MGRARRVPDSRSRKRLRLLLRFHALMLRDRRRNRAFFRAMKRVITPKTRVLDIGSGTGLWAIVAASLGARRVVAIEREKILVPLAQALARENGVERRITFLSGDSRRHPRLGEFDLIICETIGSRGLDEGIVPTLIDARRRFLAPDGTMIPCSIALLAAPVSVPAFRAPLPAGLPIRFAALQSLLGEFPDFAPGPRDVRPLAPPARLVEVDLMTVRHPPDLTHLTGHWQLANARRCDGVLMWVEAGVSPGVRIDTRSGTHWDPVFYPVRPFHKRRGDLELSLCLPPKAECWTVTLRDRRGGETQSHAPLFGAIRAGASANLK